MANKKRFWVWVTGPDYYLDRDGNDLFDYDPKSDVHAEGWWTCHKDTKAGDLVLLYRIRPKSDIAVLLEVKTDARILITNLDKGEIFESEYASLLDKLCRKDKKFAKRVDDMVFRSDSLDELEALDIENTVEYKSGAPLEVGSIGEKWNELTPRGRKKLLRDESQDLDQIGEQIAEQVFLSNGLSRQTAIVPVSEFEGSFICDWKLRFKIPNPLLLATLKSDPLLSKEWGGLRAGFRMRSYGIPERVWGHLITKINATNPAFRKVAERLQGTAVSADILSEKEFEDRLTLNLKAFLPDYDLELYVADDGRAGRQYPCVEAGGFIDLLCKDRRTGGFVVVELKVARVGRETVGQIAAYMGWVQKHLAGKKPVSGLIVGAGHDEKFHFAHALVPGLKFIELAEIRSRLEL